MDRFEYVQSVKSGRTRVAFDADDVAATGDPVFPDLALLKGEGQKMRDLVGALLGEEPEEIVANSRTFRSLKEIEQAALAIANHVLNVRTSRQERR